MTVNHKSSAPVREIVAQLLVSAGATCIECHSVPVESLVIGPVRVSLPVSVFSPITQLAIIMGILKSQKHELLLAVDSETLPDVSGVGDCTITEGLLFQSIYSLCRESKNSQVHYLTLDAMKEWLLWVRHSVRQKCFLWITSSDSYHTRLLLELVWDNLDYSVDGVPALTIKLFSLLLELYREEATRNMCADGQFYSTLIDKAIGLPWHVKGRYGLICCLLPFVGLQKVMEKQPSLLDDLTRCLGVNQLAPSSSSTLKALLECGRMGGQFEGLECQSEFADTWEKIWKAALLKALMSNQRLVQKNACLYWLPCVFKTFPDLFYPLLRELKELFESKVTHVDTTYSNSILAAYIAVLKAGRSLALLKTSELDEDFILQGLNHLQDDIRATALSIISFTTKTAEPLSAVEQRLIKDFLPCSLNTACSSFRQTLFASMKKILGRIRDSSLIQIKKDYQLISQGTPVEQLLTNCILHEELRTMFEFVDWVFNLALGCLFPGSSYQRQKTGIQLLVAVFDVFTAKWQPDKKKGQPPVTCQVLVHLAHYFGYFSFFSPRSGAILCGCIESPYCDIRDAAVRLLLEHFPWPVLLSESDCCGTTSASLLIHKALNLVRSPKVQDCESGATLFQLIHSKYVLELGCQVDISKEEVKVSIPDSKPSDGETLSCVVGLFQQLLSELQDHVTASQKDLSEASQLWPVHGLSLAIAQILQVTIYRLRSEVADLQGLESWHRFQCTVQQTVDTAVHIIQFMLEVLGGSQDMDTVCGASYAVIGETLNGLLSSSLTLRDEASEPTAVQSQAEFVMSCCWLHVKCACYLLAVILEAAVQLETPSQQTAGPIALITEKALMLIAETAKGVIVQCRHQGVVLNCRSSFVMICKNLFHSKRPSLQHLPKQWLDQMLTTISSPASLTSVTRRSAGLPVLFACALSSEPSVSQRPLLKHCMESLLKTADLSLPCVIDDHKDLPQVHAINILKALYQETSLGSAVLQFATQGTVVAVTGFASPSWAVRNASLQLFGSLVSRMVGHRRGTDNDSEMNTISARDFFNSYPTLYEFFLKHLKGASDSGLPTQSLKPELFPILTLLSKLHPSSEADERSSGLFLDLVPPITSLSSCPIYGLRSVASKALIPLIPPERLLDKAQELISLLPGLSQRRFSQNFLHGTLLQIRVLLENLTWPVTSKRGGTLLQELLEKRWIITERNPCSLTRASFLSILLEFGPSLATGSESGLESLKDIIVNSLEPMDTQTEGPSIGGVHLQRIHVKASLEILFNKPWSTDLRKIQTNEPRDVLSTFLSSPNHEQRLPALQFMCDLLSMEESSSLSTYIQVDLTNLLIKETDQCCLQLALDVFVKLFNNLENCVLCCDEVTNLWRILTSLACQLYGVSIAGKAIAACSVLLKQVLRLEAENERTSDQMLSTWCKLVEASCSWDQDELLRLGAVEGLKLCGVAVLTFALRCGAVEGNERSDMAKVTMSVLRSALCLLQDEEETIRKTAANFVAVIHTSTGGLLFRSVTCAEATERVLQFMTQYLWHSDECWVTMETLIRGEQAVENVLKDCSRSRQVLFEHEDSNLYAEPVVLTELATSHFKLVISKVFSSDDEYASVKAAFSQWFLSGCQRFAADLHSLACSGIKDYGSFPNPTPFTVRFRVMCLADVVLCVTRCGSVSDSFSERIKFVIEQLNTVLEQVIKGGNLVHPKLNEYARKLMSSVEQSRHGNV